MPSLSSLGLDDPRLGGKRLSGDDLPKMGKFRFQLLAEWITENFNPCRVADVGGGKGLLAYLLNKNGFSASVIDPFAQTLPDKYKDISSNARVRISPEEQVQRLSKNFSRDLAKDFDLLVALHAHGSNIEIIEGASQHNRAFILLPCCVIDEPLTPPPGVNWFNWLSQHAQSHGNKMEYFRLNFSGQNIGMFARGSFGSPK